MLSQGRRKFFLVVALVAIIALVIGSLGVGQAKEGGRGEDHSKGIPAKPINDGLIYPNYLAKLQTLMMRPPVAHTAIPQHPYMAPNGVSNMHADAYMSDAYDVRGPMGMNPQVTSSYQGQPSFLPTINFDSAGRIVATKTGQFYSIVLIDPDTLATLDSYELPARQGFSQFNLGGGSYSYLDNEDRTVVATFVNTIQVIQTPNPESQGEFELVREYDLSAHVVPMTPPMMDNIGWVLPDWSGEYYWFATEQGVIGTVNVSSGEVNSVRLQGELISNSFAVAEDGAYIVTDHALYRFSHDGSGIPVQDWRTEYERSTQVKPFMFTQGSGSTVTLMGGLDGLIVITDNAEPTTNLLFIGRSDGAVVHSTPLFPELGSQTSFEASVIGFEQADQNGAGTGVYSVVVENNWGTYNQLDWDWNVDPGGFARIDLTRHEDGTYSSQTIWESDEASCSLPKLSFGNGLIYTYTKSQPGILPEFYFTTLDFQTGETVYKVLTGTGFSYNGYGTSTFLHPETGAAYLFTVTGPLKIQDTTP